MYSNLTKTTYEIKDMNIQELRNRIINENNLTPLDILKGFHAKSKVTLKYTSCLTKQNLKDIQLIQQKYKYYIEKECRENLQKMYDAQFDKLFNESKNNYSDFSLQTIIDYKNNKNSLSSDLRSECFYFLRKISNVINSLKEKIETLAKEYIELYIEEKFGDTYKLCNSHSNQFENLPYGLDINGEINIDFSQVYENYNFNGDFSEWGDFNYNSHINSYSHIKFYKYEIIGISVHLSESKAKETFNNAINSIIYNNNSIGEIEFFQNLESQPITININTKTNKYELIDGYKRLLYITDEKLLNHSAPIKIFTDLNDVEFLTMLYSSNVWKCEKDFHDRGFLFALKTRFGFTIPSHIYKNYTNELEIIQLYDFGGNLVRVDKSKLMNTLMSHKHLANDIKLMYNFLPLESRKYKYDDNMLDEIMFTIIEVVGELRRLSDSDSQNELSEELIISIFEDSFVKELCSKKHLSTRTYVINYFRDKGLYKHISKILKDAIE